MKWAESTIGTLCTIGRGSSPRPIHDERYFTGGNIPWIKVADATASEGRYLFETKQHVNEYGASFSRNLPAGSLIVCTSGTLGLPIFLGVDGCIHDGWLYFSEINNLDKLFLYYYLVFKRPYFYSVAYGAAIQNINTDILRETPIPLPPLPIQTRIAEILSAYDDLIENNRRQIKLLEESARLLYREWFVRLRFPGHEQVKVVDGVPEGWVKAQLRTIATLNYGKALKAEDRIEGDYPVYGSSGKVGTNNKSLVPGPGIIIGRKGNVGSVFWEPKPFWPIDTVYFVSDEADLFLFYGLQTLQFLSTDVAVPGLNRDFAYSRELIMPTRKIRGVFNDTVGVIHEQSENLVFQNDRLSAARDLLLPRLMSGALEV